MERQCWANTQYSRWEYLFIRGSRSEVEARFSGGKSCERFQEIRLQYSFSGVDPGLILGCCKILQKKIYYNEVRQIKRVLL